MNMSRQLEYNKNGTLNFAMLSVTLKYGHHLTWLGDVFFYLKIKKSNEISKRIMMIKNKIRKSFFDTIITSNLYKNEGITQQLNVPK